MQTHRFFCARRLVLATCALACATASLPTEAADDVPTWPAKPIRIIVPFAAGGSVDLLARAIGQKLTERWRQQVVVDNRAGGGTIVGTEAAIRAPADGYTLLLTVSSLSANTSIYDKLPYDSFKDLQPITLLAKPAIVVYANPAFPAADVGELVRRAKVAPGGLDFGTGGVGIMSHLAAEQFAANAGAPMTHIIYKGGTPALNDAIAGHIPLFFGTVSLGMSAWRAGKVKALGVMSERRQPTMPDVPTFREQGFDIVATDWYGLYAPAGVPRSIVDKLNAEIRQIMRGQDLGEQLRSLDLVTSTPEQMGELARSESVRWGALIRKLGIKAS